MNGNTPDGHRGQIENVSALARGNRRRVCFGANAFVIARETEREAQAELEAIIRHADAEAVSAFGSAVTQAGQASPEGKGMWQDSKFRDLVQYNDGFRTNLIGTPEQIAERIVRLKRLGVNLILCGFLHFQDEVSFFGERVLPLVRQLEHGLSEHEAAPA
jgi:dimethylsulfone monooxygenase